MTDDHETTPSWLLHVFAARTEASQKLRPASDACMAYGGWLSASWPLLDAQAQSLMVDVGRCYICFGIPTRRHSRHHFCRCRAVNALDVRSSSSIPLTERTSPGFALPTPAD
jgi:hypothetical protein